MNNNYEHCLDKYREYHILIEQIGKNQIILDGGCNDGYIGKVSAIIGSNFYSNNSSDRN